MALDFSTIYSRKSNLWEEFEERVKDADANCEREMAAALTIKRCYMGYAARKRLHYLRECVIKIQTSYRAALGRRLMENRRRTIAKDRRMAHYNAKAALIQKMHGQVWRGYYTRTRVFDYNARKQYLRDVARLAEETTIELGKYEKLQKQVIKEQELARQALERQSVAKRLHHLVSTKCIPGVLVKLHEVREKNHTITEDMLFQVSQHKVHSHGSQKSLQQQAGTVHTSSQTKKKATTQRANVMRTPVGAKTRH